MGMSSVDEPADSGLLIHFESRARKRTFPAARARSPVDTLELHVSRTSPRETSRNPSGSGIGPERRGSEREESRFTAPCLPNQGWRGDPGDGYVVELIEFRWQCRIDEVIR